MVEIGIWRFGILGIFVLWMFLIKIVYINIVLVCIFFLLMGLLENVYIYLVVWVFMLFIK